MLSEREELVNLFEGKVATRSAAYALADAVLAYLREQGWFDPSGFNAEGTTVTEWCCGEIKRHLAERADQAVRALVNSEQEVSFFRDIVAKQFGNDAPGADGCNPLDICITDLKAALARAEQQGQQMRGALKDITALTDDPNVGKDEFEKAWRVICDVYTLADNALTPAPAPPKE